MRHRALAALVGILVGVTAGGTIAFSHRLSPLGRAVVAVKKLCGPGSAVYQEEPSGTITSIDPKHLPDAVTADRHSLDLSVISNWPQDTYFPTRLTSVDLRSKQVYCAGDPFEPYFAAPQQAKVMECEAEESAAISAAQEASGSQNPASWAQALDEQLTTNYGHLNVGQQVLESISGEVMSAWDVQANGGGIDIFEHELLDEDLGCQQAAGVRLGPVPDKADPLPPSAPTTATSKADRRLQACDATTYFEVVGANTTGSSTTLQGHPETHACDSRGYDSWRRGGSNTTLTVGPDVAVKVFRNLADEAGSRDISPDQLAAYVRKARGLPYGGIPVIFRVIEADGHVTRLQEVVVS